MSRPSCSFALRPGPVATASGNSAMNGASPRRAGGACPRPRAGRRPAVTVERPPAQCPAGRGAAAQSVAIQRLCARKTPFRGRIDAKEDPATGLTRRREGWKTVNGTGFRACPARMPHCRAGRRARGGPASGCAPSPLRVGAEDGCSGWTAGVTGAAEQVRHGRRTHGVGQPCPQEARPVADGLPFSLPACRGCGRFRRPRPRRGSRALQGGSAGAGEGAFLQQAERKRLPHARRPIRFLFFHFPFRFPGR